MPTMLRIVLDETAFRDLVAGKAVRLEATNPEGPPALVGIILSDIGFERMLRAIRDASQSTGDPA